MEKKNVYTFRAKTLNADTKEIVRVFPKEGGITKTETTEDFEECAIWDNRKTAESNRSKYSKKYKDLDFKILTFVIREDNQPN